MKLNHLSTVLPSTRKAILFLVLLGGVYYTSAQTSSRSNRKGWLKATVFWQTEIRQPFQVNPAFTLYYSHTPLNTTDGINKSDWKIVRINDSVYVKDVSVEYLMSGNNLVCVDSIDRNYIESERGASFYDDFYSQVFQGNLENIKNLIFPNNKPQNATAFRYIYDTTINDIAYKILQRISLKYFYNQETKKFDIPNELQIDYYYNTASKRLEYIKETPTSRKRNRAWPEEYYVNYYFDADTTGWYTTFDRSSPRYAPYSQGTDSEPVGYSSLSMQGNESLTDSVKKFPIVSLSNDTTNIAKQDGWILLDFWFSGCTGCIKWFHTLGKEKETLGYRILEQNGIKIMCINCLSDNVNYLGQKANDSRSQIPDIMYHAKGIGKILDMHVMPQYYLISPDKQIVYKSHDLGDYSELLQAKTEYEKKLQ